MQILDKYEYSLGLEPFDVLGFNSEEEMNKEILKLMRVRTEYKKKSKVNSLE